MDIQHRKFNTKTTGDQYKSGKIELLCQWRNQAFSSGWATITKYPNFTGTLRTVGV